MDRLDAVVQPYDWGSRHVIAQLQGRVAPAEHPEAELWMGAHPHAPSTVRRAGGTARLDDLIAAHPRELLGADLADAHDGRLPFLLKVLAAEKALSIQVHPDADQAREGFAAQERADLAADAPRTYRDDWPKPEALCALTPFEVLAGFRDPHEAADILTRLDVAALAPVVDRLRPGGPDAALDALRVVLSVSGDRRAGIVADVVSACDVLAPGAAALTPADLLTANLDPLVDAAGAVVRMAADHPGDIGLVASLLLRHRTLAPGETIFMAAGGLHAYVRGAGVEILANSDNVLRAGLTSKHIDVDELLRIVDPTVGVPTLEPRTVGDAGDGVVAFDAPASHFRLFRITRDAGRVALPGTGPRIVLVTDGTATLTHGADALTLASGQSAFVPAAEADVTFTATGAVTAFVAAPGEPG